MQSCFSRRALPLLAALLLAVSGAAQAQQHPSEETPYVPSPRGVVVPMLTLAGVRGGDHLIDLGSGDGVILLTAASRYGASGLGVDIDARLVKRSNAAALAAGLGGRVRFVEQDLFKTDIAPATVLTLYLLPEFNMALRQTILDKLRPGTRVVSHDADMGDWQPEASVEVQVPEKTVGVRKTSMVYMWTVPARLEGRWQVRIDGGEAIEVDLMQRFQQVFGRASRAGRTQSVERGLVQGRVVFFQIGMGNDALFFSGSSNGARISGSATDARGRVQHWRAARPGATPTTLSVR